MNSTEFGALILYAILKSPVGRNPETLAICLEKYAQSLDVDTKQ